MAPPRVQALHTILVTGGAGGIGRALAEYFLSIGKEVIIAGRTESKLEQTCNELKQSSKGKISYHVLDTGIIEDIPAFIELMLKEHPKLDCLVNNAAIQRPFKINQGDGMSLEKADEEINIDIRGPLHLTIGLLPHLKAQPSGGMLINISSVLGFIPTSIINPIYNGSKAFMHFFTMNLRTHLHGTNMAVVEIAPPSVTTDLHRERDDPHDNTKEKNSTALSLDEFMQEVVEGFDAGSTVISAGPGKALVGKWYDTYGKDYERAEGKWVEGSDLTTN